MKNKIILLMSCLMTYSALLAQPCASTKSERKAINGNLDNMKFFVEMSIEEAFTEMKMTYKYASNEEQSLKRYFNDREWRKAAHNYLETDVKERLRIKQQIDSIYQDSINSVLLFHNRLTGRSITLALKMKEVFKISDKNYDFLMKKALAFSRRFLKDRHDSFKREEIDALKKTLSNKQLEIVLDEKNRVEAETRALKIWDALEKANLTIQLDSLNDMYRTEKYYLREMRIGDLYVGKPQLLERNYNELYKYKPTMIKMYEGLDQRKRVEETKKEKMVDAKFAW